MFLETYIPCLTFMTVRELAVVREIWLENRVDGVTGRAFNASVEPGIRIAWARFEFCAMRDLNRCVGDSNCLSEIWILRQEGFESITRRFESPCLVFHNSNWGFKSVNLNLLTGIWIWITSWGIRIAFVSLNSLECGFESLWEGFESPSSVCTFWNVDSNRYVRDSNRLR